MLLFDTRDKKHVWIEPGFVVSVEPAEYNEGGAVIRTAFIQTLKDRFEVVDPNRDVGKQIAQAKAQRSGELSTILSVLFRPKSGGG